MPVLFTVKLKIPSWRILCVQRVIAEFPALHGITRRGKLTARDVLRARQVPLGESAGLRDNTL
jgi:hypothetical protein